MPGGAGNVARNLTSLEVGTDLFGAIGKDSHGAHLKHLLGKHRIGCQGLVAVPNRQTSMKTRVVAHSQQLVRVDREDREPLDRHFTRMLLSRLAGPLNSAAAVIVCDYGKGVVTQPLLDNLKQLCRPRGTWLSLDPKPVHRLNLVNTSLITPNRKEAFELAAIPDETRHANPLEDENLIQVARRLLRELNPGLLLITLGEAGMLLCERQKKPFHIRTLAQEVFDVSGAGDTVIASFTLAITGGASPLEAAILSNHAAGIVVGKVGTATVTPDELLASFP